MRKPLIALLLVGLLSSLAYADPQDDGTAKLKGVYALSGIRSCVQSGMLTGDLPDGFSPAPAYTLLLTGSTRITHQSGTLTLKNDGTGSISFQALQVFNQNTSPGQRPINVSGNECEVTYGANPDGTFWLDISDCTAAIDEGNGYGSIAWTVSGPSPMTLAATPERHFLQMTDATATVERVEQSFPTDPPGLVRAYDRICGRNYTAVLLSR